MRLIPLSLIIATLFTVSARASSEPLVPASSVIAEPAPELIRLDRKLTLVQQAKQEGSLPLERYAEFLTRFKTELATAKAAVAPTAENTSLYDRILARLGDFDQFVARADAAPQSRDKRSALSRIRFDEKTTPAVIAKEKAILSSELFNANRTAQDTVGTGGMTGWSHADFVDASHRAAVNLLANLPTPPAPLNDGQAPTSAESAGLAVTAAMSAAGAMLLFGGWGGDEIEKRLPGVKARMGFTVALGGVIATAGFLFIPAAPLVAQDQPQISSSVGELEPYVVDEGKIVNRVWHSDWQSVKGSSGPRGSSFCDGACIPIHAQSAVERRGLSIPGMINDAQHGGLFEAIGNIPAQIRTSIDGVETEIVIESRYWHLLKYIPESHSQLPPGPK